MAKDVKKKIILDVDSSKAERKFVGLNLEVQSIEKEMNKLLGKGEDALGAFAEKYKKLLKSDAVTYHKLLDLEKQRLALLEKQREVKKKIDLEELDRAKQKGIADKQRQYQREDWAQGKETIYQKYKKYRGIEGLGKLASDVIGKRGKLEQRDFDLRIFEKESDTAKLQKQFDQLTDEQKLRVGDKRTKAYKLSQAIKQSQGEVEALKDQKAIAAGKVATKINVATSTAQIFAKIAKLVAIPFKKLAEGAMDVVKSFMDLKTGIATFSTATTLISNQAAREQQMKYGLTSAQNFAFTQAKQMLNIQGDEDLMYMNQKQREKFLSYMQRYSIWFDQMQQSGVLDNIQEMQLEFNELKQQIGMEFLSWVAANKETIMGAIKGIFEAVKWIANLVLDIIRIFSFGKDTTSLAATAGMYTTNNRTVNINTNTTNNNTFANQSDVNRYTNQSTEGLVKVIVGAIGG